jgi:hypothetical protein
MKAISEKIELLISMYDDIIKQSIGKELFYINDVDDIQSITGHIYLLVNSLLKLQLIDDNCEHELEQFSSWPFCLTKCKKCDAIQKKTMDLSNNNINNSGVNIIEDKSILMNWDIYNNIEFELNKKR